MARWRLLLSTAVLLGASDAASKGTIYRANQGMLTCPGGFISLSKHSALPIFFGPYSLSVQACANLVARRSACTSQPGDHFYSVKTSDFGWIDPSRTMCACCKRGVPGTIVYAGWSVYKLPAPTPAPTPPIRRRRTHYDVRRRRTYYDVRRRRTYYDVDVRRRRTNNDLRTGAGTTQQTPDKGEGDDGAAVAIIASLAGVSIFAALLWRCTGKNKSQDQVVPQMPQQLNPSEAPQPHVTPQPQVIPQPQVVPQPQMVPQQQVMQPEPHVLAMQAQQMTMMPQQQFMMQPPPQAMMQQMPQQAIAIGVCHNSSPVWQ